MLQIGWWERLSSWPVRVSPGVAGNFRGSRCLVRLGGPGGGGEVEGRCAPTCLGGWDRCWVEPGRAATRILRVQGWRCGWPDRGSGGAVFESDRERPLGVLDGGEGAVGLL